MAEPGKGEGGVDPAMTGVETGPIVESSSEKYTVVPAEDKSCFQNCIVIDPDMRFESVTEIERLAIANSAWEDNSAEEAGDDMFLVQFPGRKQEALDHDGLTARLRELRGEK